MRTSKPCSTISYNTDDFLKRKLDDLIRRGFLDFYAFIEHEPEEDEEKKHKHLYLFPSKLVDTNQIREELKEPDLNDITKPPLGCMPFQSSKFADWYLYILHDTAYLTSKGQARKYHYTDEDIITSDKDFFNEQKHTIDWSKINLLGQVIEAAKSGITFAEFLQSTPISLLGVRSAQFVFDEVQKGAAFNRAGRQTHTPVDDDGVVQE